MKIIFINSAYPNEILDQLKLDSKCSLQNAVNVFQWAVIDGLERIGVDYTLACTPAIPAYPRYVHMFSPEGIMSVDGKPKGHYLRYCTMPVIKQFARKRAVQRYLNKWCEKNTGEDILIAIVYTQDSDQLGAAISLKKKYKNLVVAPIVTDLIENAMEFAANRNWKKRLQIKLEERAERKLFPFVDKFILLTSQMTECIPEAKGRHMVMEGIASWKSIESSESVQKEDNLRTLLYTGTFQEFGGLRMLVDAFLNTTDPDFRLILCGRGTLKTYVEEASAKDPRIVYKGMVSHDEVVRLQRKSTLLINPRRPNGGITKYSFPSKIMEYMTSRTPMIGYHLEGIQEEYFPFMFTPKDLSQESLTECINETLSLSNDCLHEKSEAAYRFVAEKKNSVIQVKRMIDYLSKD